MDWAREYADLYDKRADEIAGLRASLAAAVERAERAERELAAVVYELDDFAPAAQGMSPSLCVARMRTRLSERVGEIEGNDGWRVRMEEAQTERSSALSRAERAEADFAKERAQHITDIQCAERRLMKIEEQRDAALARVDEVERQRDDAIDEARSSDSAEARARALEGALEKIRDYSPEIPPLHLDNADCPDCKRAEDRKWPPSHLCAKHYDVLADSRQDTERIVNAQHIHMRAIARAALSSPPPTKQEAPPQTEDGS